MNASTYNIKTILAGAVLAFATCSATPAFSHSKYWEQRVTLFNIIPVEPGDIVFLGNSITDGGEFTELFDNPAIKNRGIISDVISGVRDRLYQVTDHAPSKIFLLIGINDVSHNLSAGKIAADYEELVREIREKSPQTTLYIQSVMPINNDFGRYKNLKGKEKVVVELNKKLVDIAERNGAVYVDLWDALADPATGKLRREFTNDGLHLLGKGYDAWADAIRHLVKD